MSLLTGLTGTDPEHKQATWCKALTEPPGSTDVLQATKPLSISKLLNVKH